MPAAFHVCVYAHISVRVFELILLYYGWLPLSLHSILLFLCLVHAHARPPHILSHACYILSFCHMDWLTIARKHTHAVHTQTKIDSHWQTHFRELTWSGFILLSIASKLIFAEGLTDITEFHLTYQDLIPVAFTNHSFCVFICHVFVCTALFVGLRVRGTRLPAHVYIYCSRILQASS